MNILNIFTKREKKSEALPFTIQFNNTLNSANDATTFACVDLICSAFASLSVHVYNKATGERVKDHWLEEILAEPNFDDTKFLFMYSSAKDYLYGNVYWYKWTNDSGFIGSLFRIDPAKVTVYRDAMNMKVFTIADPKYNGKTFDYTKILHIPSRYGYDGLKGKSFYSELQSTYKTINDMDDFVNNSFNNNIGDRTIIDISKSNTKLTAEQEDGLRNKFMSKYSGNNNARLPLIQSDKIEFKKLDSSPIDNRAMQLLENREFNEKEVSKILGVPLSFLKGENKYGDIETLYTVFIDNAIKPVAESFEGYMNKLLFKNEIQQYEIKFDYNSMMKTSMTSKFDTYVKQIQNSILTVDEVRFMEGRKPYSDGAGETPLLPVNLMFNTKEIQNAYMANSKLKIQEAKTIETGIIGDDKL